MSKDLVLILGVTGSGKSRAAFDLAKRIDGEIISVDSMKVYRRIDIGTAKPDKGKREQIKYHLIDVAEPSEAFSVGVYLKLAEDAIDQITGRGKPVIAVGGTAMYIKALMYGLFEGAGTDEQIRSRLREAEESEGLGELFARLEKIDPETAERVGPNDSKRIIRGLEVYELTGKPISSFQNQWESAGTMKYDWKVFGLRREKDFESRRINKRVKKMIDEGLVDEVKSLIAEDKPLSKQARCAIGHAEIINYLDGQMSLDDAIEKIKINTRRLAKHQRTWFKTFTNVDWIDIGEEESGEDIHERIGEILSSKL